VPGAQECKWTRLDSNQGQPPLALERERLTQQANELRDQLHRSQVRWSQLAELTSKLHTMAIEGVES